METGFNILLCGVGGQGVVLASKLLAYTAMEKYKEVRTSETIGMAQRGGSVVSHVRMGEKIASPLIPKGTADVIMAFEPAEAVRNLSYLKAGGTIIVNKKGVRPITATLSEADYEPSAMLEYLGKSEIKTIQVDGEAICEKLSSPRVLNIIMLGAAIGSGTIIFTKEELTDQIRAHVNSRFLDLNLRALEMGTDALN
jgi:indolepyruvate ferredoxin oxidoreductase beta subunit